jgi:4-amino-4-deoxychorismate lyase
MHTPDLLNMELNGAPVQLDDLKVLWLSKSYGHYTVLPVSNAKVRGLTLHMERLQRNTQALYGYDLDTSRVRAFVRHALAEITTTTPLAVWVEVYSHPSSTHQPTTTQDPDILVTVRAMPSESPSPLRIRSAQYQRDLPQVKHAGTFGLRYHYRRAQLDGFDDVVFADASGRISEGSGWNIGFFDGNHIIWPGALALPGVAMQLIQAGAKEKGISFEVRDVRLQVLPAFRSAFLTHVLVGTQLIASIDDVPFVVDSELSAMLRACYEATPPEAV